MQRILILVLAVLLATGCYKSMKVVGIYKMQMDTPAGKANDPAAAIANALGSMMTIELKADNTFTMPMAEGTYSVSGNKLQLTATKVMGQDVSKTPAQAGKSKTMEFRIEDGGKTLVPMDQKPKTGKPSETKFVRE